MEELGMKQKPLDRLHCVVKRIQPKYIFPQEDGFPSHDSSDFESYNSLIGEEKR